MYHKIERSIFFYTFDLLHFYIFAERQRVKFNFSKVKVHLHFLWWILLFFCSGDIISEGPMKFLHLLLYVLYTWLDYFNLEKYLYYSWRKLILAALITSFGLYGLTKYSGLIIIYYSRKNLPKHVTIKYDVNFTNFL